MKELNQNLRIGIVGCGHLGLSLAKALIANGMSKSNLRISYGGNPETLTSINLANLQDCISTNENIFLQSDIVFITLRPDGITKLANIATYPYCLILSCVAGIESKSLKAIFGHDVIRLMPSSPQSIESKTGIAAIYPTNEVVEDLLFEIDIEIIKLEKEKQLHFYTALVCLPAAYLKIDVMGMNRQKIDLSYFSEYRFEKSSRVIKWAAENTPENLNTDQINNYISHMATKGGITEVIVESIENGSDINQALQKGIERGENIATENGKANAN